MYVIDFGGRGTCIPDNPEKNPPGTGNGIKLKLKFETSHHTKLSVLNSKRYNALNITCASRASFITMDFHNTRKTPQKSKKSNLYGEGQ